jgi:CRISPR-associated endonuclease/helicase Cas3
MEPNRILAKSIKKHKGTHDRDKGEIYLKEHTRDVWDTFENLTKIVPCATTEKLKQAIQIAIICHDFGKVLPAFQQKTLGNKDYRPFHPYNNIPHSLFSVFWMNGQKIREILGDGDIVKFVYSAVAFHHWRNDFDQLINWSDSDLCEILDKLILNKKIDTEEFQDALYKNLKGEFRVFPSELKTTELISFNSEWASGIVNGLSLTHYVTPPYKNYFLPKQAGLSEEQKRNWILISGFLMRCDHFASFCEEENEDLNKIELYGLDKSSLEHEVERYIKDKNSSASIWQLDKVKDCRDKNAILIAPTGYGKTEFAFLWSNGDKFLYTLPLRSAVNQIFERAKNIFTDEKTGLLHSDADVYLLGDGGETDNLKVYDFARQLSHPVIISTGDQFFPYALKPPSYEKVYATISYSRLVIDEVQAYDPKAAAIIVKFIEDIVLMGGKFLLMTATLPEFVKEGIERRIYEYEKPILVDIYIDRKEDFQKLKKHRIKVIRVANSKDENGRPRFDLTEDNITQILDYAKEGKRVLVILNTVRQAQEVYQQLRDKVEKDSKYNEIKDNLWLLHSRFTWNDRENKETTLIEKQFKNPKPDSENAPKILVATQVVEASLDIDADTLFTEIAPLDALVQRMGRVLRRFKENYVYNDEEPNVYIWTFENGLESGNGNVYKKELIGITLRLLYSKKAGEQINKEEVKEWIKSIKWEELEVVSENDPENTTKTNKKGKGATKEKKRGKPDKQNVSQLILPIQPFLLSEFKKYELVKQLYKCLPEDSKYLKEFYDTLRILDAGYMSDRKEEAHKIFREIYDIQLIPENKVDDFIQEIKEFFKDEGLKEPKHLFTFFKKRVLSKFVVSDGYFKHRRNLSPDDWVFYKVFEKLNKNEIEEILEKLGRLYGYNNYKEDDFEKKLKRWLSGIYAIPVQYDENRGIIEGKSKAGRNNNEENQEIENTKDNLI